MYSFDRTMVQAEMDYRGAKLLKGARPKRRNRFKELHHVPVAGAADAVKRAR